MTDLTTAQTERVQAILALLDRESGAGTFPYPQHDRLDYAGMRVHAYRGDGDGWALLFEMYVFDGEAHRIKRFHGFCNQAFLYSSRGGVSWEDRLLPSPIARDPDGPSVSMTEERDEFIDSEAERRKLNPDAKAILIRGQRTAISHDRAVYESANIEPSDPLALRDLLRLLMTTHRDALFSTDDERQRVISHGVPGAVKLLTLDEFRHFDMDDCDAPSETEAMRMLAEVVATGDPSRYAPTERPNTHWRVVTGKEEA